MRIAFFGSAPVAIPTLDALIESAHDVCVVFTQPDRRAGRGGHIHMTEVKQRALAHGIPLEQPVKLKTEDADKTLRGYDPDLAVVVAYGKLIPPVMLEVPAHGFINTHPSLLPRYRGAAPVPHAILNGDTETGVTVFRLNEEWDAGDILSRTTIPIDPDETAASLLAKVGPVGAREILGVVGQLEAGWVNPIPQPDEEATRAPKLKKEDGRIDWSLPPERIDRMIRAFQPWPTAFTFVPHGKQRLRMSLLSVSETKPQGAPGTPGTVLMADPKRGFVVQCGQERALELRQIKIEGKRAMSAKEYLRGVRLAPGTVLTSKENPA